MRITNRNNTHMLGNQGPVLLDAHGFGCSQKMWGRVTPAFADSHRQILFDYVGSGQSDLAAFDARRYASMNGYAQDGMALVLAQEAVACGADRALPAVKRGFFTCPACTANRRPSTRRPSRFSATWATTTP